MFGRPAPSSVGGASDRSPVRECRRRKPGRAERSSDVIALLLPFSGSRCSLNEFVRRNLTTSDWMRSAFSFCLASKNLNNKSYRRFWNVHCENMVRATQRIQKLSPKSGVPSGFILDDCHLAHRGLSGDRLNIRIPVTNSDSSPLLFRF